MTRRRLCYRMTRRFAPFENDMNRKPTDIRTGSKPSSRSKVGGIAIALLVGVYTLAAPLLNERFDWNLPAITADGQGNIELADEAASKNEAPQADGSSESSPVAGTADKASSADSGERLHGILREVSPRRFLSPEGLMYTPGSAEGHRLKHLERHVKDAPSRPQSHGVFDGGMPGALLTIDRAYQRAKKNQKTTKEVDDGRTIYTVDMGGRVGFVGGKTGKRKGNPMARRVRLVIDGNRVITAFPL